MFPETQEEIHAAGLPARIYGEGIKHRFRTLEFQFRQGVSQVMVFNPDSRVILEVFFQIDVRFRG